MTEFFLLKEGTILLCVGEREGGEKSKEMDGDMGAGKFSENADQSAAGIAML